MNPITRRAFLRYTAALLAFAGLPARRLLAASSGPGELETGAAWLLGRAQYSLPLRVAPSFSATVIRWFHPETVFTILGTVLGDRPHTHNNVWYLIPGGYVHSAWVQPVPHAAAQPVAQEVPEWGFWGEICRPTQGAIARKYPHPNAEIVYTMYPGSVHHVVSMVHDQDGRGGWYELYDELPPETTHWVRAHHLHRLTDWELRPISPHVPLVDKRIEISISAQTLTCYEGEQPVFFTRCATGAAFTYEDGSVEDFSTPKGEHVVILKQPSRHMQGGIEGEDDYFDLPGVPWNTFFTYSGIAIHGTYWHNDYGVQRSHGCVNVTPDAARWVFRWVYPVAPYEDDFVQSNWDVGTPIIVT